MVTAEDDEELRGEYLRLTREVLPALARGGGWVVRDDHCFQRIVLDHLFADAWYAHLGRPAYRHLDPGQLRRAVALAARLAREGDPLLRELNAASLRWRGKGQAEPVSTS